MASLDNIITRNMAKFEGALTEAFEVLNAVSTQQPNFIGLRLSITIVTHVLCYAVCCVCVVVMSSSSVVR